MSGCTFRCQYCHNPDTWKTKGGRKVTIEAALAEIKPYKNFLRFAGGVTVSGGEPMVQAKFVGELLRRIKETFGLHTALDTQGVLHRAVQNDWLEPIDLVLLDVKHSSPEVHLKLTGQPLQPTIDFAQRLCRLKKRIWLRYVLVPGLTDEDRDILRLADFAASLEGAVERVDVLPYHRMGMDKWKMLGIPYLLEDVPTPTAESINHALELFSSRGLKVNQEPNIAVGDCT